MALDPWITISFLDLHTRRKKKSIIRIPPHASKPKRKFLYTIPVRLTPNEVALRKIETIFAGNGKVEIIIQDAQHVFEA